jgi:hypothetical protein
LGEAFKDEMVMREGSDVPALFLGIEEFDIAFQDLFHGEGNDLSVIIFERVVTDEVYLTGSFHDGLGKKVPIGVIIDNVIDRKHGSAPLLKLVVN